MIDSSLSSDSIPLARDLPVLRRSTRSAVVLLARSGDGESEADLRGALNTWASSEVASAHIIRVDTVRAAWEAYTHNLVQCVCMWRMADFVPSVAELWRLIDRLGDVRVVALGDNIDTARSFSGTQRDAIKFGLDCWFSIQSARIIAGLNRARERGKRLGRPLIIVDPDVVLKLVREGKSYRTIYAETGINRMKVKRIVDDPAYQDKMRHKAATVQAVAIPRSRLAGCVFVDITTNIKFVVRDEADGLSRTVLMEDVLKRVSATSTFKVIRSDVLLRAASTGVGPYRLLWI